MRRWAQITSDYWLPQVGEGEADALMRGGCAPTKPPSRNCRLLCRALVIVLLECEPFYGVCYSWFVVGGRGELRPDWR